MAVLTREDLTAAEAKAIEQRHAPYHRFEEFWDGFASYDCGWDCPNRWEENSVAGQAWDRGTEAAMRLHWEHTSCPYARDDLDSLKQIATLRRVADEYQRRKAEQLKALPLAIAGMATGAANDNELAR
jgi:hypothetical protein